MDLPYQPEIDKAGVNELPLWRFEGPIVMVDGEDAAQDAARVLSAEPFIGMDTETRPAFKKGQSFDAALLQLGVADVVYLVRLNQHGLYRPIAQVLENAAVQKIGIAPAQDLLELQRCYPCEPQSVLDLNKYCNGLGFDSVGARKLAALVLGKRISKRQQLTNWEATRLSTAQKVYAATDAWICHAIFHTLQEHPPEWPEGFLKNRKKRSRNKAQRARAKKS
jgi:ribonuclease D